MSKASFPRLLAISWFACWSAAWTFAASAMPVTLPPEVAARVQALNSGDPAAVQEQAAEKEKQTAELTRLRASYRLELETLAKKLDRESQRPLSLAVRIEKARLDVDSQFPGEVSEGTAAPFEVIETRRKYLDKVAAVLAASKDRALKARAARIEALATELAESGDQASAEALRTIIAQEQAAALSKPVGARTLQHSIPVGGSGGGAFEEIAPEGGLLTGLVVHTGDFAGHHVVTAIRPIFQKTPFAVPELGAIHGTSRTRSTRVEAAPGYAVGAMKLNAGDRVDGLSLTFMRIQEDGRGLDPADSYESEWVGGKGGGPAEIKNTLRVAGIFGGSGSELDFLGLLLEPAAREGGSPLSKVAPVKSVTKENPAQVTVAQLSAEPLVESARCHDGEMDERGSSAARCQDSLRHSAEASRHRRLPSRSGRVRRSRLPLRSRRQRERRLAE